MGELFCNRSIAARSYLYAFSSFKRPYPVCVNITRPSIAFRCLYGTNSGIQGAVPDKIFFLLFGPQLPCEKLYRVYRGRTLKAVGN